MDLDQFKGYTPGPWRSKRAEFTVDGEFDFGVAAKVAGEMKVVAEAFGRVSENGRPDAAANAALIAAAPSLLEYARKLEAVVRLTDQALKECAPVKRGEIYMRDVQNAIADVLEAAQ